MKIIKCTREIASIKVQDEIVNFQGFKIKDRTITVTDRIAKELLDKQGFELIEDLGMDETLHVGLTKYNRPFKKLTWIDKFKSLFTGGKTNE